MSEENKEIENPDKIIDIVEEIIVFNKKNSIKTRTKDFNTRPNAQFITNYFSATKSKK